MRRQNKFRIVLDSSIVMGYSVFAFVVMPVLVIAAWLSEKVSFSSHHQVSHSESHVGSEVPQVLSHL